MCFDSALLVLGLGCKSHPCGRNGQATVRCSFPSDSDQVQTRRPHKGTVGVAEAVVKGLQKYCLFACLLFYESAWLLKGFEIMLPSAPCK